jgi:hypothetical protein
MDNGTLIGRASFAERFLNVLISVQLFSSIVGAIMFSVRIILVTLCCTSPIWFIIPKIEAAMHFDSKFIGVLLSILLWFLGSAPFLLFLLLSWPLLNKLEQITKSRISIPAKERKAKLRYWLYDTYLKDNCGAQIPISSFYQAIGENGYCIIILKSNPMDDVWPPQPIKFKIAKNVTMYAVLSAINSRIRNQSAGCS